MNESIAPITLDCGVVTMRPWRRGDEQRLLQIADDPRIAAYMADVFPTPYTMFDAATWIEQNEAANPKTHCAISLNRQIIGGVGYDIQSGERRLTAQFGYWLGVSYWGLGIATAACRAMTAHAFERHALRRIEAAVYVPNVASRRVLEKCGYRCEGLLRNAVIKNGVVLDAFLYATAR